MASAMNVSYTMSPRAFPPSRNILTDMSIRQVIECCPNVLSGTRKKKKWTGWKSKEEQSVEFNKKVMEKNEGTEDDLDTIQRNIETAAGMVAPHTKSEREYIILSVPENVRLHEEAAARCTAKIKRSVLKKQARKARAEHQVECCLEPGKEKAKRKPLTELCVKVHFTEDREEWQKNFRGIVKTCPLNRRKQKKHRKAELNISRRKEISNLQRKDAMQKSK